MYEKNKRNKIMPALLILACSISCLSNAKISVSKGLSEADKAKKAYEEVLTDEKAAKRLSLFGSNIDGKLSRDGEFAIIDLNQDGIPEMLYTCDDKYHIDTLCYVNGRVKKIYNRASSNYEYYPNKSLCYVAWAHGGYFEFIYCKFTGKKMKVLADEYGELLDAEPRKYTVNGKKSSYKHYKVYVKKLMKGVQVEKPQYHKNTASNRKKYL